MQRFQQIDTWVFDLDHTLYPPSVRLFDQIEERMTAWVMQEAGVDKTQANHLRQHYWATYGTTLAGLMRHHDTDPAPYMVEVHDIDFSALTPDPALTAAITALPGRKIVYTNGCEPYARKVLAGRGLEHLMHAVYGVEHASYRPKPEAEAFAEVFARDGLDPTRAAMFEDDPRNLAVPHALGMATVHVADAAVPGDHIHHHTNDLAQFLTATQATI